MKKFLIISLALLLVSGLIFGSCAQPAPTPAPAPAEPIKIGTVAGLTGFMAVDALECVKGIELKLDEVGYEWAGRKIEFIKEDYASDPGKAVDKARKLVEHDKVDVILGPLMDAAGFAVADHAAKSRTPNITFHSHVREVVESGDHVFQWPGTTPGMGYFLGLYAYDELGYRTATVIRPDSAEGEDIPGGCIIGFEERGGTTVQNQAFPPDGMDFAAYLTAMKEADCCIFWHYGGLATLLVKQYYDYGLKMPLLIPIFDPLGIGVQLAELGDICLGMVGSDFYSPLIETDINKRFVDAFHKKYGYYPCPLNAGGYIAVTMFLEAAKATGGDTSHEAIIDALYKIKIDTPAGTYSFQPSGLGIGDFYICEVTKIGDRYAWKPIHKYSQIVVDVPK